MMMMMVMIGCYSSLRTEEYDDNGGDAHWVS